MGRVCAVSGFGSALPLLSALSIVFTLSIPVTIGLRLGRRSCPLRYRYGHWCRTVGAVREPPLRKDRELTGIYRMGRICRLSGLELILSLLSPVSLVSPVWRVYSCQHSAGPSVAGCRT